MSCQQFYKVQFKSWVASGGKAIGLLKGHGTLFESGAWCGWLVEVLEGFKH